MSTEMPEENGRENRRQGTRVWRRETRPIWVMVSACASFVGCAVYDDSLLGHSTPRDSGRGGSSEVSEGAPPGREEGGGAGGNLVEVEGGDERGVEEMPLIDAMTEPVADHREPRDARSEQAMPPKDASLADAGKNPLDSGMVSPVECPMSLPVNLSSCTRAELMCSYAQPGRPVECTCVERPGQVYWDCK